MAEQRDPETPKKSSGSSSPTRYGRPEPVDYRKYIRWTIYGVAAGYTLLFLIFNSESTDVSFVFFSTKLPLFMVLGGTLVMGAFLGAGALYYVMRQKDKEAQQARDEADKKAKHGHKKSRGDSEWS